MEFQTAKAKGRDPVKRGEILSYIRKRVADGEWLPGEKLPPRTWFEQKFGAAPLTVQRTFQILIDDKVLESEKRLGTRVAPAPPHLNRYGIILYGSKKLESLFSRVLVNATREIARKMNIQVEHFFVLGASKDPEDYRKLLYGVENNLFAGLLFSTPSNLLKETPFAECTIPKLVIDNHPNRYSNVTSINFKHESVFPHLFAYFQRNKSKRIAAILGGESKTLEKSTDFAARTAAHGMECPPGYVLEINANSPLQVKPIVHLLFSKHNAEPPEGLYIADDNFLPHVIEALKEIFGEKAAEKVKLASLVNFPRQTAYDFPVKFFGFDLASMFEQSVETILAKRNNGKEIDSISINCVENSDFEHKQKEEKI